RHGGECAHGHGGHADAAPRPAGRRQRRVGGAGGLDRQRDGAPAGDRRRDRREAGPLNRLEQVPLSAISDPELLDVLDRAERLSTPKPAWYQTLAHAPDMAVGYSQYWDLTHRGGQVEHTTKELMRIAISTLLGCGFCADQRSVMAVEEGLDED